MENQSKRAGAWSLNMESDYVTEHASISSFNRSLKINVKLFNITNQVLASYGLIKGLIQEIREHAMTMNLNAPISECPQD